MALYKNKLFIENSQTESDSVFLFDQVVRAFNLQDFQEPPEVCVNCGKEIQQLVSQSKVMGFLRCYSRICNACKTKDFEGHLQQERISQYANQKLRCAELQNQKSFHIDHFPQLAIAKDTFGWQKEFFNYIYKILKNNFNGSLLVQGNPGSGKTYLAKVLLNELVDQLVSVCFAKAIDLAIFIKKLTYRDDYRQIMRDFKNVDMLIIDDFGTHHATDITREILFSIFDARYENRKRTLVTTNLSNEALLKFEPRTASRMLDERWMDVIQLQAFDIRQKENLEGLPF